MEVALGVSRKSVVATELLPCLNPCFCGSCSWSVKFNDGRIEAYDVLILVFVEVALGEYYKTNSPK